MGPKPVSLSPIDLIDKLLFMDETVTGRRKWRLLVGLMCLGFTAHIAWACGYIPQVRGFALASEQENTSNAVERIELRLLDQDILEAARLSCEAQDKRFFINRLNELIRKWQALTPGTAPYVVPSCEALGYQHGN
jgi:hypothetical protein